MYTCVAYICTPIHTSCTVYCIYYVYARYIHAYTHTRIRLAPLGAR